MIFGEGPIIKNIAGDLNKLFLQGTRAGQPINNVEGDAAADQGTVQLMADRDPVIRDISTGLGWAGREVTVSGTGALQLVNSLGRPLKSWSVELAPYQEGSGDPSPENVRPIHGTNKLKLFVEESYDPSATPKAIIEVPPLGKNLFNPSTIIQQKDNVLYGCTLIKNADYTFSTSYTITGLYVSYSDAETPPPVTNNAGWTFLKYKYNITSLTFNSGDHKWYRLTTYESNGVQQDRTYQLELGSSPSTYEPFNNTVYNGTIRNGSSESRMIAVKIRDLVWSSGWSGFYNGGSKPIIVPTQGDARGLVMCEIYNPVASQENINYSISAIWGGEGYASNGRVYIHDNRYATVDEFISAMGDTTIYLTVSSPTEFEVAAPNIPTIEGDGFIWITAEDGIVTSFSATYLQTE